MDIQSLGKSVTKNLKKGICNDILTNPIYVAMLITAVVLLIIICIYEETKLIKTGFYILLSSTIIIFLHNSLCLQKDKETEGSFEQDSIARDIAQGGVSISGGNTADSLDYLAI